MERIIRFQWKMKKNPCFLQLIWKFSTRNYIEYADEKMRFRWKVMAQKLWRFNPVNNLSLTWAQLGSVANLTSKSNWILKLKTKFYYKITLLCFKKKKIKLIIKWTNSKCNVSIFIYYIQLKPIRLNLKNKWTNHLNPSILYDFKSTLHFQIILWFLMMGKY